MRHIQVPWTTRRITRIQRCSSSNECISTKNHTEHNRQNSFLWNNEVQTYTIGYHDNQLLSLPTCTLSWSTKLLYQTQLLYTHTPIRYPHRLVVGYQLRALARVNGRTAALDELIMQCKKKRLGLYTKLFPDSSDMQKKELN